MPVPVPVHGSSERHAGFALATEPMDTRFSKPGYRRKNYTSNPANQESRRNGERGNNILQYSRLYLEHLRAHHRSDISTRQRARNIYTTNKRGNAAVEREIISNIRPRR